MKKFLGGAAILLSVICASPSAYAINCVSYVKSVTDFNIMGDAWQWWDLADHTYGRGYTPAEGAVMVFSRTPRMRVGHVAVVREVRSQREIIIDQANWHHGRVDRGVSVIDISENNDWSQVKVQWTEDYWGGSFPISGFIYPTNSPLAGSHAAPYRAQLRQPQLIEASYRPDRARGKSVHLNMAQNNATQNKGRLILAGIQHASFGPGLQHKNVQCAVAHGSKAKSQQTPVHAVSVHQTAKPAGHIAKPLQVASK